MGTKQGSAQPSYSPVEADLTHPSAITAGDTIYVGEQRCNVIHSDSDNANGVKDTYQSQSVVCAQALSENAHSTADAICTHDVVEVSFEGASQSCSSTDRPALRFIHDDSRSSSTDECADASACAMVLDYNGANRLVRWSSGEPITLKSTNELMDNNDLSVNDRVQSVHQICIHMKLEPLITLIWKALEHQLIITSRYPNHLPPRMQKNVSF